MLPLLDDRIVGRIRGHIDFHTPVGQGRVLHAAEVGINVCLSLVRGNVHNAVVRRGAQRLHPKAHDQEAHEGHRGRLRTERRARLYFRRCTLEERLELWGGLSAVEEGLQIEEVDVLKLLIGEVLQ